MTNKSPTLVVFDLDDTIYSYEDPNRLATSALVTLGSNETGLSEPDFKEVLFNSRDMVKNRLGPTASSHSRLLYIHEALSRLGFSNQPLLTLQLEQEFWRTYISSMKINQGVENFLTLLRFNDVKIALVTDLTLQIQLRKLIYLKIDKFFDVIVASEETSGDKITLQPFELLTERCQTDWLKNVWFIGDSLGDIPVDELIRKNRIKDGKAWLRSRKLINPDVASWNNFSELESYFLKVIS